MSNSIRNEQEVENPSHEIGTNRLDSVVLRQIEELLKQNPRDLKSLNRAILCGTLCLFTCRGRRSTKRGGNMTTFHLLASLKIHVIMKFGVVRL
ncbi:hypothetical protein E2542_SST15500 [Spatholobus suberectus]|nr:hypothetical protein E2542_SST15500 [Spatholobus suberectus]